MKNELKQENIGKFIVDREVNHPEKRHPCRLLWLTRVYLKSLNHLSSRDLLNLLNPLNHLSSRDLLNLLNPLNPFSRCPLS